MSVDEKKRSDEAPSLLDEMRRRFGHLSTEGMYQPPACVCELLPLPCNACAMKHLP